MTSGSPAPASEINITPLIDVMLVLLIIFMVVTPIANRGLDVGLPAPARSDEPPPPPPPPLVLVIGPAGISLNRSPVPSLADLGSRLREILQPRADRTLFVQAAGEVAYGQVVAAMDVARGAGAERIGIVTRQE